MKQRDTPFRRILDWCIVFCILVFTLIQFFSHYSFSKKYLEYMEFADGKNESITAAYDYLEITNALSSDMTEFVITGNEAYLNHYFLTLNSPEHQRLLEYFLVEQGPLSFPDVVGKRAEIIAQLDMHILKLCAVSCGIPDYQMEEDLRNLELTEEEKSLSSEQLMQKAHDLAFGDGYSEAKLRFAAALTEYENDQIARNETIEAGYAELITTQTRAQQTMLLLTGAMTLLIVILLYRQMTIINKMLVDEQQYKGALITDAIGVFEVNLTEDRIEAILSEKDSLLTNELKRHKLNVPCPFSEFLSAIIAFVPPADAVGMERFSAAYFINQFQAGNRYITREGWYSPSDDLHVYLRNTVILSQRPDSESVYALVVFRDVTSEKLEYDKQHRLIEMSLRSGQQYLDALRTDSVGIYESNITHGTIEHILSDTPDHKVARFFQDIGLTLPGKVDNYRKALLPLIDEDQRSHLIPIGGDVLSDLYSKGVRNQTCEVWINMPDGDRRYLKNTMLIRREEESGDLVSIAIIKDCTEQQLEFESQQLELMQQKARNEAKNKFFSSMSHDIRTPLNGVIGMIDLVRHHMDEPDRIKDYVEKIDQSSKHLLSLINDVLDMSAIDSGKVEIGKKPVNILSVLDECFVILNSQLLGRDIVFNADMGTLKTPVVLSDSVALKKIFMNILSNAVKFTRDGGSINFKAEYAYSFDGKTLNTKFIVSDTGIGISPEFIKKVFDPFCQENSGPRTTYQGTGLGLAIVKQYVDILSGTVTVQSEKNKGTTFVVELPFELSNQEGSGQSEVERSLVDVSGLKVLLVDDNELNIEIVQMLLEDQGVDVTIASNGREAVEAFSASEEGHFDAIIMDIMMPVMDGLEASGIIRHMALTRKDAESVPIIALTANAFTADIKKTEEAGMTAHLSKPIVPAMLMETLTRCCRGN